MMELNSLPLDSGGSGGVGFHAPTSSGSTSATSSATTTPMADANGNTLGAGVTAGAVSPVAAGDSGSVHRVGHKRSHSRDAAPGGSGGTLHWFAVVGDEKEERRPSDVGQDGDVVPRPGSATRDRDRDREREERARGCREKQEEDRRRKLEELKQQALAAQKFREQQEEERKRHIEEVRERESQRRQLVEERKRALVEADRERKEQIIKRNQERDERMDTRRRHERGQIVFAFGSSTPRMASDTMSTSVFVTSPPSAGVRDNNKDVADNGGTFWGHRRSTSSFNVNSVTSPMPMANSPPFAVGGGGGGMRDVMSASSYHQANSSVERPSSAVSRPVDDIMTQSMSAIIPGSSPFGPSSSRVRRRTDLTPTVPSSHHHLLPRGGPGNSAMETSYHGSTTSSVSSRPQSAGMARKTPGRAVSLSRLDQLSQPRRGRQAAGGGGPVGPPPTGSGKKQGSPATLGASDTPDTKRSMSKSMVHLGPKRPSPLSAHRRPPASAELTRSSVTTAGSASAGAGNKRGAVARSMTHLAGSSSAPPVRMTRAERLRLGRLGAPVPAPAPLASRTPTLDAASASAFSGAAGRSGSTTPSTPSRPLSALSNASQVSAGGVASAGVVRRRHPPGAASAARLKPRPMSIAGTSVEQEARPRRPVGEDRALQRRDSASGQPKAVPGSAQKRTARRSSAGPTTPKKEPAGAVGASSSADNMVKAGDTGTIKRAPPKNKPSPAPKDKDKDAVKVNKEKKEQPESRNKESGVEEEEKKQQKKEEVKVDETAVVEVLPSTARVENVETQQEQEQESGSVEEAGNGAAGKQPKITTEEEAKAAIAERRRLAREQADREAEEQRRREEEERLAEEERQRREEEDHRKWEAEQERLMEEARKAEEERLRKAIEDAERQAEEEKRRKEEEARQKAEREEQEKKAREEAERSRLEREEKLRLEEEERQARRRKVEAIMSRTRGARSTKDGDQSGPSSSTSAASSASGNQTSIESVVAVGGTAGPGAAVAPPSGSSSSSSAAATPTTLTPSASMAMSDSMTASMYEEAARKLDEEEQQQRKLWDRGGGGGGDKAVLVNGNLSSSSSAAAVVDTNGHSQSNGDLGNGFLVDLSSLQSGVLGQNTSGNLGIDGVGVDKSSTNPFVSSLDQNNSNMASNAIDLLS